MTMAPSARDILIFVKNTLLHEELSKSIIGAFFESYDALDFGFLEHICVNTLERELVRRGHVVSRELGVQVWVKNEVVGTQRLDMVVDDKIIVEVKSSWAIPPGAMRQITSYLRGTNLEVGLLLHFGEEPTFHRFVFSNRNKKNLRQPSAPSPPDPRPESVQSEAAKSHPVR
jgi:GxxExxY protein